MRVGRLFNFAVSAALALSPALYAAQEKPVVHSLGVTSLKLAKQRATLPQFSSPSRPHGALPQLPKPHFTTTGSHLSTAIESGQTIEFPVVGPDAAERGFSGINTEDSNDANADNQGAGAGIGEPPDQGLAASETQVFETVNLSLRIFSTNGTPLSDNIGLAAFFGVPFSNASLSDPRVFFDPQSKRFFMSVLEFFNNPNTGAFIGSLDLLAVSQTSDATGNYFVYAIDGCPSAQDACLADQPLIGVNDDGFYFSNNDYNSTLSAFIGAQIVGLNKEALINNTPVSGIAYLLPNDFSVQPALPAPGAVTTQHSGTEFFTESLDNGPPTNGTSLRIFALTNTESLESSAPATILSTNDFPTESYSFPVSANQKAGSIPLGQQLGDPEELLRANDDRMQQLYFANGKLYTTLETELKDPDAPFRRSGAAWFVIDPEATDTTVAAHIVAQGYIGIQNGSVLYPAFAVNNSGEGIIGFSFSGTNFFPSTGYVHYHNGTIGGQVHTAGAGQNPEDGFSGYAQFGGHGAARWGDYSAAFVSPNGHLWFGAEYIPNLILHPRTPQANWGTFVSRVQ